MCVCVGLAMRDGEVEQHINNASDNILIYNGSGFVERRVCGSNKCASQVTRADAKLTLPALRVWLLDRADRGAAPLYIPLTPNILTLTLPPFLYALEAIFPHLLIIYFPKESPYPFVLLQKKKEGKTCFIDIK